MKVHAQTNSQTIKSRFLTFYDWFIVFKNFCFLTHSFSFFVYRSLVIKDTSSDHYSNMTHFSCNQQHYSKTSLSSVVDIC